MRRGWKFVFAAMMFPAFIHAITVSGTVCGDNECVSTLSGVLVKLYNGSSISDTVLQDDTTTNTSGFYTLNWGTNGQKIFVINQPGYNNYVAAVTFNNGGPYTVNMTLAINNNTSTITGTVVAASNSAPIDSTIVILSGGVLGSPISVRSNSQGQYAFDSVGTGTGYSLMFSGNGYKNDTLTNINAPWNSVISTGITALSKSSTAIEPISNPQSLSIYSVGSSLILRLPSISTNAKVSIADLFGREVFNQNVGSGVREITLNANGFHISPGLYFIRLTQSNPVEHGSNLIAESKILVGQ